jgi:hypothetical protein
MKGWTNVKDPMHAMEPDLNQQECIFNKELFKVFQS